jgi:predicted RNA binding protein YcfA (HicA-like mRNA interferase family)
MKLPRDVAADRLIQALERLGYKVIRQRGSHVRLFHEGPPMHTITIPQHSPLKIGTLHGILSAVARTRLIAIESIIDLLRQSRSVLCHRY